MDITAFDRHERIAFQLSAGRDSVAALHQVEPWLHRMRVYWVDTGDAYPETRELLQKLQDRFGFELQTIKSDVWAYRREHGLCSDIVPTDATPVGRMISGETVRVADRYHCTFHNLQLPLHERMVADGISLVIRGTRRDEFARMPLESGQTDAGIEYLYPIQEWTEEQVDAYVQAHALPMAPWYAEGQKHGAECMHCTAWWDDGRFEYLAKHHPEAHELVMQGIGQVLSVVRKQTKTLLEVCNE